MLRSGKCVLCVSAVFLVVLVDLCNVCWNKEDDEGPDSVMDDCFPIDKGSRMIRVLNVSRADVMSELLCERRHPPAKKKKKKKTGDASRRKFSQSHFCRQAVNTRDQNQWIQSNTCLSDILLFNELLTRPVPCSDISVY